MKRGVVIALVVCGIAAVAVGAVLYVRAQQQAARDATLAAVAEQAAQLEKDAQAAEVGLDAALDAYADIEMHFTNMNFYVNTLTVDEEVEQQVVHLERAKTSLAAARKALGRSADTTAGVLYTSAIESLESALEPTRAFIGNTARLGQIAQDGKGQWSGYNDFQRQFNSFKPRVEARQLRQEAQEALDGARDAVDVQRAYADSLATP